MVDYPKILIRDKRKRFEIGSAIETDAEEKLRETMHTWPSLFGTSCCIMWLLDSSQQERALSTAIRDGALPKQLVNEINSSSKGSGDLFEGYKLAVLTATQILQSSLSTLDRYGINEMDKSKIRGLANNVRVNLQVFRKNLVEARDRDQFWKLMDAYGQMVQLLVEGLCVKLLVNERRKEIERISTFGV